MSDLNWKEFFSCTVGFFKNANKMNTSIFKSLGKEFPTIFYHKFGIQKISLLQDAIRMGVNLQIIKLILKKQKNTDLFNYINDAGFSNIYYVFRPINKRTIKERYKLITLLLNYGVDCELKYPIDLFVSQAQQILLKKHIKSFLLQQINKKYLRLTYLYWLPRNKFIENISY